MFGIRQLLAKKNKMKREIIINAESMETRVAILEDGKVEEFKIEHPTEERIVGSVFRGRVQNLERGLRAAFVDIGLNKNAFIHYWDMIPEDEVRLEAEDGGGNSGRGRGRRREGSRRKRHSHEEIAKRFPVGTEIVVQVTKAAIGTKGPRVTANISIPGRYLVLLPGTALKGISRKIEDGKERHRLKRILGRLPVPENAGLIVRTVAERVRQRSIARDMRSLLSVWEELVRRRDSGAVPCCLYEEPDLVERTVRDWLTEEVDRIVVDSRERFEETKAVARAFGRRMRSRIQLYEGDAPIYEHFNVERQMEEALRRKVPLKSGGHIVFEETEALIAIDVNTGRHKSKSHEDAIVDVNIEAVEEVARQLRLRNVGGLVMIDLIDMKQRKCQNSVYRAFKDALKRDRARTNVLPISKLGILEMSRQRVEESILSSLYTDCPYCRGRGQVKSALSVSVEIQRYLASVMRRRSRGKGKGGTLRITVHPSVLERLKEKDEQILVELEAKHECRLMFRADPTRHHQGFVITDAETGETLYSDD
jgi:ribonuclease G